jgi:D-alanine-D-alanine ligase
MIHGNPGENGKIPAYLDMLNIPYTCSNMLASAITFKKSYCKKLLEDINIKTPKGITIKKQQKYNINDIINIIKFPCIIKPDEGGSSFGTSIANNEQELISSIQNGFNYDNQLLIEELIKGRELTNGILKFKSNIIKLPVTEIITKT